MISYKYPIFEKGRILKVEMLDSLRDFPFDLVQTRYADYSDGILCGFDVSSDGDIVFISKGIVKYDGRLYILKEDMKLRCDVLGMDLILKIKFHDYDELEKDFYSYTTEVIFDTELNLEKNDIEICRFDLRSGARLRSDYIDLYDMTTKYDTVNIVHAPFSAYSNPTLSPRITRFFAKEILKFDIKDPFDINFCMMCLNNDNPIDSFLIVKYINYKLGNNLDTFDNMQLYNGLCKVFEFVKDNNSNFGRKNIRTKQIIVD